MTWMSATELTQARADVINMLPDSCDILSVTYTRDGEGGSSETWGTISSNVPCRIDYRSGRETLQGGAIQPYTNMIISLPYNVALETTNRIFADGQTYAVKSSNARQSWIVAVRAELERIT